MYTVHKRSAERAVVDLCDSTTRKFCEWHHFKGDEFDSFKWARKHGAADRTGKNGPTSDSRGSKTGEQYT